METAKVAVITGAAQGIGRRTAEILGVENYALVLVDLQSCDEVIANLRESGVNATAIIGDLTDDAIIASIVQTVQTTYGRIDALINNAGISSIQSADLVTRPAFERVMAINLVAPFLLSQAFFPLMRSQRQGSIINIASIAGLFGIADRVAYNASKHGLIGMTRTLAAEWGALGIRCNAICPGWVKTEMDTADQSSGHYTDEDIISRVPMGRFATPTDIAQAVTFLADPARSGFVNGHALVVDGGWTSDASWDALRMAHREGEG
jgi:NAD(P)-dependent dehydrogenase (short-subunit alcohol dehydrogenase family)